MAVFFIVPGTYPSEVDLSGTGQPIGTNIGAAVFGSKKGPVEPTLLTGGQQQFLDLFGLPDVTWSFGHHSCLAFLSTPNAGPLWTKRTVNNALYAGLTVTNNLDGALATKTSMYPFMVGRSQNYLTGERQYQHIVFGGPLVSTNSVSVILDDGTNNATISQPFNTDNNTTLTLLANLIASTMNATPFLAPGFDEGGAVAVYPTTVAGSDARIVRVQSPGGELITLTVSVSGASAPTVTVQNNPWLFDVYAQNPGAWADNYGIQILNVHQGVRQRITLTLSSVLQNTQVFNAIMVINGAQFIIGPVNFDTDNNTTMAAIANAISVALGPTGECDTVSGGANILELLIVAPISGPNVVSFTNIDIAGGGTIPTIANVQTIAGVLANDTFDIWLWKRPNLAQPIQKFTVSFAQKTDGNGNQLLIEDAVNNATGNTPNFTIRVTYNAQNQSGILNGIPADGSPIVWLANGNDGQLPTNNQIAADWASSFSDRVATPMRIMINCGYTNIGVQAQMASIAQTRYDCFAILDQPSLLQDTQSAVNWRKNIQAIDSNYAGLYSPDPQILDQFSNLTIYVPPSGYVAAAYCDNDAAAAEWFAPAGLNRGVLKNIVDLRENYGVNDMEILIPQQINPIIKRHNSWVIWGANTLQSNPTALSNISVRRMLITIEVSLVDSLDYTVFEPNDPYTQFQVSQLCTNFLQPIKDGRGLRDFLVVCNASNNPPYFQDIDQLNVALILKPILPVKFIKLTSVITTQGAVFSETIGLLTAIYNSGTVNSSSLAA